MADAEQDVDCIWCGKVYEGPHKGQYDVPSATTRMDCPDCAPRYRRLRARYGSMRAYDLMTRHSRMGKKARAFKPGTASTP